MLESSFENEQAVQPSSFPQAFYIHFQSDVYRVSIKNRLLATVNTGFSELHRRSISRTGSLIITDAGGKGSMMEMQLTG